MKTTARIALIVCAALAATSPAHAQFKGTPAQERAKTTSFRQSFESREIMGDPTKAVEIYGRTHVVAKCIAGIAGSKAGGLLGGELAGDASYRAFSRNLERRYQTCTNVDPNLPPILVSGALAETLVVGDGGASLEDRAKTVNVTEAEEFFGGLDGTLTMETIAGCLSVYSPGMVYKVLGSEAESPEEISALNVLFARTPECGISAPPADIARIYQRGALATALYQWTHRDS